MKPTQSLEWIKEFETRSGGLNYRVCGVDCWPVIRNTLLSIVHAREGIDSVRCPSRNYTSIIFPVVQFFRSVVCLLTIRKADTFILGDSKFSEDIAAHIYLKDVYALAEEEALNQRSTVVALQNKAVDPKILDRERCVSIYPILFLSAVLSKLSFLICVFPRLSRYLNGLLVEIYNSPLFYDGRMNPDVIKKQLLRNIFFCIVAAKLFSLLLLKVDSSKAYVVCYYSVLGMSLCAACNQLGIPVSDIQHGVSGRNMRAYAGWVNCPANGYTTLPNEFLTWTQFDTAAINEHEGYRHGLHRATTVGPLWRSYKAKTALDVVCRDEWQLFVESISRYQRKIAITLQSSVVPKVVMDLIESCGGGVCFLIRAHPDFNSDSVIAQLSILGNRHHNVFVFEPSRMPMQLLMSISDVNITGWSASVYDAYFEGVRSIVVSGLGCDYFEDFIRSGFVYYTGSSSMLKDYALTVEKFIPCEFGCDGEVFTML